MREQIQIQAHSHAEECAELLRITTHKHPHRGSRVEVAKLLRLSESTVADYLTGKIKHSSSFVQACFLATDRDPEIGAMLEPPGFMLCPCPERTDPLDCIEKELGDVHLGAGQLHSDVRRALEDGHLDTQELSQLKRRIRRCIEELMDVERFVEGVFQRGEYRPGD